MPCPAILPDPDALRLDGVASDTDEILPNPARTTKPGQPQSLSRIPAAHTHATRWGRWPAADRRAGPSAL
jgi:hypothetical protein